jgi:hypothetical protein
MRRKLRLDCEAIQLPVRGMVSDRAAGPRMDARTGRDHLENGSDQPRTASLKDLATVNAAFVRAGIWISSPV